MKNEEIVKALRCVSTAGGENACEHCSYWKEEEVPEDERPIYGADTMHSCDVDRVGLDGADLIERLTDHCARYAEEIAVAQERKMDVPRADCAGHALDAAAGSAGGGGVMERLTRRINGVVVYVGAKNPYSTGQIPCEVEPAGVREMMDRLAAYEDTRLTPERCAEFARADVEGRYIVMRDAEQEGVSRLRELAEADRAGRLVVLPKGPEVE